MANPKHLAKLREGVVAWNEWRKKNPDAVVDLSESDLREASLHDANLCKVNLIGASLKGADLGGSDLREAKLLGGCLDRAKLGRSTLIGAYLRKATLIEADLHEANLRGADLGEADLQNAYLREACLIETRLENADFRRASLSKADFRGALLLGTEFREANLYEADFTGAFVGRTGFVDIDLRMVRGLETLRQIGPSAISIGTLYMSEGMIPDAFLRGAGVSDEVISLAKGIAGGIQFYSCFISYSSKDQEFADRLYADLQAKGIRCWLATEDLKIGDRFRQSIDEAIRLHDKLLVVLSEHSVNSGWVESEVEAAFERENRDKGRLVLFPVRLDNAVMEAPQAWAADIRRKRHIGDCTNWRDHDAYKKAFERVLRDLKGDKSG